MSTLTKLTRSFLAADMGRENDLPIMLNTPRGTGLAPASILAEDEGLFLDFGHGTCAYPYRAQDGYTRALTPTDHTVFVLENENLRAEFVPAVGGKLWSLFDKQAGRELFFSNSVIRPCNLAVRNAWTSGGVEWNCGILGHHPYTCSLIHTATTELDDGTPVLRMYQFERIRNVVYQMDFFLPDGAKMLYCRMRIDNRNSETIPMYWWSNIAVPQNKGDRVIVPATETYTTLKGVVQTLKVPVPEKFDITYPYDNPVAIDYFFKTEKKTRKYVAQVGTDGYGLLQFSTSRLQGRKLFVWGNSVGGNHWQSFLSGDGESGSYDEIQAGIAHSQYESLPMPPKTAWEWIECYGAISADPTRLHGEWADARDEVENTLNALMPEEELEQLLLDTKAMALTPAKEQIFAPDGWAALENLRRAKANEKPLGEHLVFGEMGEEQADWVRLLEEGTLGEHDPMQAPVSYIRGEKWGDLLRAAVRGKDKSNWYTKLMLGLNYAVLDRDTDRARLWLEASLADARSPYTLYALAQVAMRERAAEEADALMAEAFSMMQGSMTLATAYLTHLHVRRLPERVIAVYDAMNEAQRAKERNRLLYAASLVAVNRLDEAEEIMYNGGQYLILPDLREGETGPSQVFTDLRVKQTGADPATLEIPEPLDFRMSYRKD